MVWLGGVTALVLAAFSAEEGEHALVSIAWGGGADHAWTGTVQVAGPGATVAWSFPQDLEPGDQVLAGPGFTVNPYDFRRTRLGQTKDAIPPLTVGVTGTTQGDADGLFLEVHADQAASLLLSGFCEARAVALRSLMEEPLTIPVGDAHLVLRAFDLRALAPLSHPHAGTQAWPVLLHTHSCCSTSRTSLEPQIESLLPFVRTAWWTDHNPGNERNIICGDFEDRALTRWYWRSGKTGGVTLDARRIQDDEERGQVYVLRGRSTGNQPGRLWCRPKGQGVGNLFLGLAIRPRLHFAWHTPPEPGARAFVQVQLSSGRSLRYLSGPVPSPDPTQDLVLPSTPGQWESHNRDLQEDLLSLDPEALSDGIWDVSFGIQMAGGTGSVECRFDDLRLELPAAPEWIRRQEQSYQQDPRVTSYMGMEQSSWDSARDQAGLTPHLTLLPPTDPATSLHSFSAPPSVAERAATVRAVQEVGGVAGAHHLQIDEAYQFLYDQPQVELDLFEIGAAWRSVPRYASPFEQASRDQHGYPPVPVDGLLPLLVRYDATLQRGLLFTLYGAPDLHGEFHRSSEGWFNRWITTIHSTDATPANLLRNLRRGQAIARDFQSGARLSLQVHGRPWMGRQVVTDGGSQTVTAQVEGALPGSTLRWVTGLLDRRVADSGFREVPAPVHVSEVALDEPSPTLVVDTREARFVRAELVGPHGALEALTNPILFLPYWPQRFEEGRVAFDVQGFRLHQDLGVWLTHARLSGSRLRLHGEVVAADHCLVIHCPQAPLAEGDDPWEWNAAEQTVTWRSLPSGAFDLELRFASDRPDLPVGDPRNIPPRKHQDFLLDLALTGPQVEERLQGGLSQAIDAESGTSVPTKRHLPGFRGVQGRRVLVTLPLPTDRDCWVQFVCAKDPELAATLLLGDQELDSVAAHQNLVFRVPAPGGEGPVVETPLTLTLERAPAPMELRVQAIQVRSGPGVVDY